MNKFSFNKKRLENTLDSGKEKVNEQIQFIKRNNYSKIKIIFFTLLLIGVISLGFYYNIIQNIFYSFLSIIVIVMMLVFGLGWEYIIFTNIPLHETPRHKRAVTDVWEKIEHEFDILITDYEQKIKQTKKYSILNYMTSVGLFLFSCIVILIDWIYDKSFSLSAYQKQNPALLLSIVLIFFSLIFMLMHYLNQKEIAKLQEKFLNTERWIISIKYAHLLGKDKLVEELFSTNNNVGLQKLSEK